ncbi:hypothetical protein CEXT_663421 [Caerostris extrusa]|uniref:Uncharacterized protein n=1 Tax=Caerostris extrusa TaxID=172846 RepID=A0AAV4RSR4_CAEEX|nr:hypothetical protein CEXT_663421 [Caerostris extrusa]
MSSPVPSLENARIHRKISKRFTTPLPSCSIPPPQCSPTPSSDKTMGCARAFSLEREKREWKREREASIR